MISKNILFAFYFWQKRRQKKLFTLDPVFMSEEGVVLTIAASLHTHPLSSLCFEGLTTESRVLVILQRQVIPKHNRPIGPTKIVEFSGT
jgi:hypothetical protein